MKNIWIINGPNLNLLGQREPETYGDQPFEAYLKELKAQYPSLSFSYYQSNVEGELVSLLQQAQKNADGIILNGAGYTHTSVALADAVAAISIPVVEVHISNLYVREEYRHISLTGKHAKGVISGFGLLGYQLAVEALTRS